MKDTEKEAKLIYQRALYRVHDCDDPDLKQYFESLIKDYEKSHPEVAKKSVASKKVQPLPLDFVGHGLA